MSTNRTFGLSEPEPSIIIVSSLPLQKEVIHPSLGSSLVAAPVNIAGRILVDLVGGIVVDEVVELVVEIVEVGGTEDVEFAKLVELNGNGETSVGAVQTWVLLSDKGDGD